jgi:hypothetical protein
MAAGFVKELGRRGGRRAVEGILAEAQTVLVCRIMAMMLMRSSWGSRARVEELRSNGSYLVFHKDGSVQWIPDSVVSNPALPQSDRPSVTNLATRQSQSNGR